jgi:uncharacterized protein DUF3223
MKNQITIGNRTFKCKKDAIDFYKIILNSYDFGELLNRKHFNEIKNLIKLHPDFENKFNFDFDQVIVDKVKFNTKSFQVIKADSTREVFSYLKCINGQHKPQTKFNKACRDTIQNDLREVKNNYFKKYSKNGKVKCQETGILSKWDELVIDHRQPNTFSVIIDRFIEINDIDLKSVEYDEIIDGIYYFKDKVISKKFKQYHKEKANLRIIRKEINSGRAFQGRISKQKKDLKIK